MKHICVSLCVGLIAIAQAPAAQAQQSCPAAGTAFNYHDKYEGTVYSYDHGLIRVVSVGGEPDYSRRCHYKDDKGQIWKLDRSTPLQPVAANAPRPVKPADPVIAGAIPVGVYECDAPHMIGGMVMPNPQTGPMFGVFGPASYRDFRGGRGTFSLSGNTLTMKTGPLAGIRYLRADTTLFYPLDAKGQRGSIRCVLNSAKSLNGRW